jgi:hypothetical protein
MKGNNMKTNKFSTKAILIFIAIFMSASLLVAAIIDTDKFNTNAESWTGTNVSWDSSNKRLKILRGATATKIFDVGIANAGKTFKVDLLAAETTWGAVWESNDKTVITSNSIEVYNSDVVGTIIFNATADVNGKIALTIKANSDKAGEDLYIDNINIDDEPSIQEKEFERTKTFNMQGNMKTIGNTVLCQKTIVGNASKPLSVMLKRI